MGVDVLVLIGLINFLSAFIQASCGFGYAMVAMSLMPLVLPMRQCSSISAVTVLVIAVQMCLSLWRYLNWRNVWLPVLGCMLTINLGMYCLMRFDEFTLRLVLAGLILLLTVFFFCTRRWKITFRNVWYSGAVAGLLTGLSTGMFNIVGPFFLIYYVSVCENMLEFKACMEFSFLIAGLYSTTMHLLNGNICLELFPCYLISMSAACLAGWLGLKVFRRIDKEKVSRIVYVLLPVLALTLLWNSR